MPFKVNELGDRTLTLKGGTLLKVLRDSVGWSIMLRNKIMSIPRPSSYNASRGLNFLTLETNTLGIFAVREEVVVS